jgi:hypothetical protein
MPITHNHNTFIEVLNIADENENWTKRHEPIENAFAYNSMDVTYPLFIFIKIQNY